MSSSRKIVILVEPCPQRLFEPCPHQKFGLCRHLNSNHVPFPGQRRMWHGRSRAILDRVKKGRLSVRDRKPRAGCGKSPARRRNACVPTRSFVILNLPESARTAARSFSSSQQLPYPPNKRRTPHPPPRLFSDGC